MRRPRSVRAQEGERVSIVVLLDTYIMKPHVDYVIAVPYRWKAKSA